MQKIKTPRQSSGQAQGGSLPIIIAILAIALIIIGAIIFTRGTDDNVADTNGENTIATETTEDEQMDENESDMADDKETTEGAEIVTYTSNGFSPETVTVSVGDTVRFVNNSGNNMWVASDMHPTHADYDGTSLSQHCPDPTNTSFDQCESGEEYTFTFTKTGTWNYHNHVRASHSGTIIVQ